MILDGLNAKQLEAVTAVRGPVCILAGAGTGKTTTITRRIAHQIATSTFSASDILAVTFTERAATEMRERLSKLGAGRVRAKTFHAEALAQIARLREAPRLLDSKARLIVSLVQRLPPPYKFRPVKDFAGEIEWAKNRLIAPSDYADKIGSHDSPVPADLMARVYAEYEQRKRKAGVIDFEDLLAMCAQLLRDDPVAAAVVQQRYRSFTVDEYQDVNLLQQQLLDAWLGDRTDVCVVGDDYQSIFGFTGASPDYLTGFARTHPTATVVTLEDNHRSTMQVLEVANRLAGSISAYPRELRSTKPPGPEPRLVEYTTAFDEVDAIVKEVARIGPPWDEIAVLYRINARSEDFEEAFARAGIPYQVRDGAFLRRPGPRALLVQLERYGGGIEQIELIARDLGWTPDAIGETPEEVTRLADLGRLVAIAKPFEGTVETFVAELRSRFGDHASAAGVILSTYHRSKGLEWDTVFLPRLEEREMPFALSKSAADVAEERRLLYVGITRARTRLQLSWASVRDNKTVRRSRFVEELLPPRTEASLPAVGAPRPIDGDLFMRLRTWRQQVAKRDGVPAYVVFHDATLRAICDRRPGCLAELATLSGVGPAKLAKYGSDLLDVVAE